MPLQLEQLQHLLLPKTQPDPFSGLPLIEVVLFPPAGVTISNGSRWVDSALVEVPTRIKSLLIIVDTAITSAGAQQATVQLFAARTRYATLGFSNPPGQPPTQPATPFQGAQSGAGSQFPSGAAVNAAAAVGPAVNFAASVASIPVGPYWFTSTSPGNPSASPPTSMTELAQEYPVLGIEITAPAAFTGGALRAFFELAPI